MSKPDASMRQQDAAPPNPRLTAISTQWSRLNNPVEFVIRYAPAIERYLRALIGNDHDAEEVAQEFLLKVTQRGFERLSQDRGRFRDYLIAAVRNAAVSHLRKKQTQSKRVSDRLEELVPDALCQAADRAYQVEWQRCILDKAWRNLHRHERSSPGNLYYTALKLTVDFPEDDSTALAARAAAQSGAELRPEAFRKQLSRARKMFAELIVNEVLSTLESPGPGDLDAELAESGLMAYVGPYLA